MKKLIWESEEKNKQVICRLKVGPFSKKTLTEVLKLLREVAGHGQRF